MSGDDRQQDWTEGVEWSKAPPVKAPSPDTLVQAGFMMGLLRQQLEDTQLAGHELFANFYLRSLKPEVAKEVVERGSLILPLAVLSAWRTIQGWDATAELAANWGKKT